MDSLARLIALCLVPRVGKATLRALLKQFGTLENVLAATNDELQTVPGVGPKIAAGICAVDLARTMAEMESWQEAGVTMLPHEHPNYPARLRECQDAPPVLFHRGALSAIPAGVVSIVGTREPTEDSRQLAIHLGFELTVRGWTVVSGLAWGIDYAAHQGAVRAGQTVAVLGSGVCAQQPEGKRLLAENILANGAMLSETHPYSPPSPPALVARNRIISGLSCAVIVVEAGARSGSLHAARQALKQGRRLFVVDNGGEGNATLLAEVKSAQPLAPDYTDWDALRVTLSALL